MLALIAFSALKTVSLGCFIGRKKCDPALKTFGGPSVNRGVLRIWPLRGFLFSFGPSKTHQVGKVDDVFKSFTPGLRPIVILSNLTAVTLPNLYIRIISARFPGNFKNKASQFFTFYRKRVGKRKEHGSSCIWLCFDWGKMENVGLIRTPRKIRIG